MTTSKSGVRKAKKFLTFSEVQNYLGVKSRKTVLKYIKSGHLPAYKLGGTRWRVSHADMHTFLDKQRTISIKKLSFRETKPNRAEKINERI